MSSRALYDQVGPDFLPGVLTRGGWSDRAQHGSPPAGILARAIELVPTATPMQVVRLTVDLFREVPLEPLRVDTAVVRDGRRIQVVRASLHSDGVEVGQATALKVRLGDPAEGAELVGTGGADDALRPGPEGLPRLEWRGTFGETDDLERFHTDGVEIRTIDGSFLSHGPGRSWFRLRTNLVRGEPVTPFQRMAVTADLANGNSQALDPRRWLFVNPDITLYVYRPPEGEWIGMRSVVHQDPHGIGVTDTAVYDLRGRTGHISQAQVIAPR